MRSTLLICASVVLLLPGCDEGDSEPHVVSHKPRAGTRSRERTEEAADSPAHVSASGGKVQFGALEMTAPESWPQKAPQSSFTAAEFVLPGVEGPETAGRLTLSMAGGSVADNIERWKGQFGGTLRDSKQETLSVSGLSVTLVDLAGDFNDQRGPYAPAVKRAEHRMIAAIIPVGGELHFVKAVGPCRTIDAHVEEIRAFIQTAKTNQ